MTDNLPRLYTEDEAASYLGVNPRTLARLRKAGQIRHILIADRRYRYLEDHLLAFLKSRGRGPKVVERELMPRPIRAATPGLPQDPAVPLARIIFGVRASRKPAKP